MAKVLAYERPQTLAETVALLTRPGTVPLAGGTHLNAVTTGDPAVVVDLQALASPRSASGRPCNGTAHRTARDAKMTA